MSDYRLVTENKRSELNVKLDEYDDGVKIFINNYDVIYIDNNGHVRIFNDTSRKSIENVEINLESFARE